MLRLLITRWPIKLWFAASIIISSILIANTVAALRRQPDLGPIRMPAAPAMEREATRRSPTIERDIFCSTCKSVAPPRDKTPMTTDEITAIFSGAGLLVTMIGDDHQAAAVVRTAKGTRLIAVGQSLDEKTRVVAITSSAVVLLSGDRKLRVVFGPAHGPAKARPRARPRTSTDWVARGISRLGPRRFVLKRSMLLRLIARPARVARCGRVIPRRNGFELLAIRPGCLWSTLGLQSGDRLQSLNGRRVRTVEDLLTLYKNLRHATRITASVRRGRKNVDFDFRIR